MAKLHSSMSLMFRAATHGMQCKAARASYRVVRSHAAVSLA